MNLVEFIFIRQISKINISTFKNILDKNISFMAYFVGSMPSKEKVSKTIRFFRININNLTPSYIAKLIAKGNPEAFDLIMDHPNGFNWLKKTVEELKRMYGY